MLAATTKRTLLSILEKGSFLCAFGFICLFAGFVTTVLKVFPYPFFDSALTGLSTVTPEQTEMYGVADSPATGVTRYDPERAYQGYTIYSSSHTQGAFLIDMQGRIVHAWSLPFSRVWNRTAAEKNPVEQATMWDRAWLYPDGSVLAIYIGMGQPLWGYGLAKIDRNSHLVWSYLQRVHHDVTVGPDGRIYTLTMRMREDPVPGVPELKPPTIDNSVVVLSPNGRVLKQVSVVNALARSKYRGILEMDRDLNNDPVHLNSVTPMPENLRKMFPSAGPNTVLISSRQLSSIALLDLDSSKIVWLLKGPFVRQHDAEFQPNGDITLFDDVGDARYGRNSRVIEFQPNPFKIVWQFPGDSGEVLDSPIMGGAQKLPNGNVLITETCKGRILEVSPDQKVVWEYRNPIRHGDQHQYVPIVRWARRFSPDQLHFDLDEPSLSASNRRGVEPRVP